MSDVRFNINSGSGTYEVSSALTVGGRRQPRLSDGLSHPCLCTRADGTQYVIAKKPNRTTKRRARQTIVNIKKNDWDLMQKLDHDFNS